MSYTQDAIDARAMLAEDGQLVTLTTYTDSDYSEATSETTRTSADISVYGALFDFFFGEVPITGTEVQKGDKRLYMAAIDEDGDAVSVEHSGFLPGTSYSRRYCDGDAGPVNNRGCG